MTAATVLMVAGAVVVCVALAAYIQQNWFVERIVIDIPLVAAQSSQAHEDQITIVQLSDLHGRTKFLSGGISRIVNDMRPDIVCLTGDLTNHLRELPNVIAELARIRCSHVFFILGNHERYEYAFLRKRLYTAEQIEEMLGQLREAGIVVLNNGYAVVPTKAGPIAVSGFDNSFYGFERVIHVPDTEKAAYKIALGHSPNIVRFLQQHAIDYNLILAGHTHGGQLKLFGWSYGASKHFHTGMKRIGANQLFYISRGLGNVHLPLRMGSRPEIAAFRIAPRKMELD